MFLEFLWGSNWQYFPHDKPGVVWIFIVMKIIPVCFERIIRLVQTSSLPAQLFSDQRARAEDYCNTWPLVLGLELNTSPARCSTVTRFSSQQERSILSVAAFLVLHSDVLTVQCPGIVMIYLGYNMSMFVTSLSSAIQEEAADFLVPCDQLWRLSVLISQKFHPSSPNHQIKVFTI